MNQGVDVTEQYLKNARFDINPTVTSDSWANSGKTFLPENWSAINTGGDWGRYITVNYGLNFATLPEVFNSAQPPTTDINGNNAGAVLMMSGAWASTVQLGQAVKLVGGICELQYDVINQNPGQPIQANYFGFIPTSGTATYDTEVTFSDSWQQRTVQFIAREDETSGQISIGIYGHNTGSGNSAKLAVDNIRLIYYGIDKSTLTSLIEEADKIYNEGQTTAGAPALKSAIDAAQEIANKADASQGEVSSAEEALAAAIKQYPFDNATPENPLDLTSYIKNPTMETATDWTWTGDIQNKALATNKTGVAIDGAFTGNFYEGWNRSKYTGGLSQTINGLVSGIYRLKAGAFNEAATESGVYLYGNEYETAVTSSNPMFYTVDIYVNNGTLTIGLRSDNNTTNWLGLDNVSLSYIGYDVMTVMDLINGTINEALSLSNEKMQKEIQDNISYAINAIYSASTPEEIETAINDLTTSMAAAKASIQIYAAFKNIIDSYDAANYQGAMLPAAIAEAKGAAESAYESAEKDNFSEEIAALNAAQASVASLVISGNMSTLIYDPTMDGGETATVWKQLFFLNTNHYLSVNCDKLF